MTEQELQDYAKTVAAGITRPADEVTTYGKYDRQVTTEVPIEVKGGLFKKKSVEYETRRRMVVYYKEEKRSLDGWILESYRQENVEQTKKAYDVTTTVTIRYDYYYVLAQDGNLTYAQVTTKITDHDYAEFPAGPERDAAINYDTEDLGYTKLGDTQVALSETEGVETYSVRFTEPSKFTNGKTNAGSLLLDHSAYQLDLEKPAVWRAERRGLAYGVTGYIDRNFAYLLKSETDEEGAYGYEYESGEGLKARLDKLK
ncbi:MAG: hypothetical protein LBN02_05580 [Oscillospiraceae bacterium]|jgi:hypothetical protein|nr:hypothetical protein [Oscillospiraceae bacterium]